MAMLQSSNMHANVSHYSGIASKQASFLREMSSIVSLIFLKSKFYDFEHLGFTLPNQTDLQRA